MYDNQECLIIVHFRFFCGNIFQKLDRRKLRQQHYRTPLEMKTIKVHLFFRIKIVCKLFDIEVVAIL